MKIKCPRCGNEDKEKFQSVPMGGGMWEIRCAVCGLLTERFAPVGNKAKTSDVIEWLEGEVAK